MFYTPEEQQKSKQAPCSERSEKVGLNHVCLPVVELAMRHFQSEVRAVVKFLLQFLLAVIFPHTRFSVKLQKDRDTLCV